MSRKTQTFPKYVKLKIDQDSPPADLWERGSRKCQKCDTKWPCYSIFNPSPCCDSNTEVLTSDPEMTWREAVKRLLKGRFERYYEKWNDDVTDEALVWDQSIDDNFPIREEDLRQGLEEIERLISEPPKTTTEQNG